MEKTIDNLVVGDILYYAYIKTEDDNCPVKKMSPIIGQFKITSLEIITSYQKDISDPWEESEYITIPCNEAKMTIEPNDDKAKEIIELTKDKWYAIDFYKPFKVSRTKGLDHTSGYGTCLDLFTTKKGAIESCVERIEFLTPEENIIEVINKNYNYNKEQIKNLKNGQN